MAPQEGLTVRVFGQRDLVAAVARGRELGSHLISIGNPPRWGRFRREDERVPPPFRPAFSRILRLEFFDVPSVDVLAPGQPKRIPELRDAARVVRFFRQTQAEATGYVVHCWGGISRSPAVALALWYLILGDEAQAARRLMADRREALPHQGLVAHFDQVLGSRLGAQGQVVREARLEAIREALRQAVPEL